MFQSFQDEILPALPICALIVLIEFMLWETHSVMCFCDFCLCLCKYVYLLACLLDSAHKGNLICVFACMLA